MDLAATFNAVEAVWWWLVAALVLRPSLLPGRLKRAERWTLAATFLLFGVSDVIEIRTGAWWRPVWLMLMKIACIAAFIAVTVRAAVRMRRPMLTHADPETAADNSSR